MREFSGLTETVNEIGEGPLWIEREQALYWIDAGPTAKTLMRYDLASGRTKVTRLPQRASSVIERRQGGLVLGFQRGLAALADLDAAPADLPLAGVDFDNERFNDSAVDARGRLWIGTFDRKLQERLGKLYRVEAQGGAGAVATRVDAGFMLSNGIAWSPDGQAMYFCDSRPGVIFRYRFDAKTGRAGEREVFLDFAGREGRPDGCAMDAQGNLWVAEVDGSKVITVSPAGQVVQELHVPVRKPTSVAFGGPQRKTLFITSMTFGLSPQEREAQPLAGRLFACDAGVAGLPVPAMDFPTPSSNP